MARVVSAPCFLKALLLCGLALTLDTDSRGDGDSSTCTASGQLKETSGCSAAAVSRPCGCGTEHLDFSLCTPLLAQFRTAGDADSVLGVTYAPAIVQPEKGYSIAISAAHLLRFNHSLSLEHDDRSDGLDWGLRSRVDQRIRIVRHFLISLRKFTLPGDSPSPSWGWLMLLDVDAAMVSDEDVLRRILARPDISRETHVVLSMSSRAGGLLDSGALLVRCARWSEGFLAAWLQELSTLGKEANQTELDSALAAAVGRARKLGGSNAVLELPPGTLATDFMDQTFASVRDHPVARLRGVPDEVRERFFRGVWHWACERPGGLGGRSPAVLQRQHLHALAWAVERVLAGPQRGPRVLHEDGRPLRREEHTSALMDRLASYADLLRSQEDHTLLRLCYLGYDWASATQEPGAKLCLEHLQNITPVDVADSPADNASQPS